MRTLFVFTLGFIAGRFIYLQYTRNEALAMEARVKKRISRLLWESGLSQREASRQAESVYATQGEVA